MPPLLPFILPWVLTVKLDYQNYYRHSNIPADTSPGSGERFIRSHLADFVRHYGFLGPFNLFVAEVVAANTREFNTELKNRLETIEGNVVYLDIYSLVNELTDNPALYGFDDIILPACGSIDPLMFANMPQCKNARYRQKTMGKNFLWSDFSHPGPLTHLIFAQYMASVFNAPVIIAAIPRHLSALTQNHHAEILTVLLRTNPQTSLNHTELTATLSGAVTRIGTPYNYHARATNTTVLNLGLTTGINPRLLIGAMLSLAVGISRPYENFNYRYDSQIVSIFGKYLLSSCWWTAGEITFGQLHARQINRGIILGYGKRTERGKTATAGLGLTWTSGYDFTYGNGIRITPYLNFTREHMRLAGFSEEHNLSTSMHYRHSHWADKKVKLAVRITKPTITSNVFAELGLSQPLHNPPIKIKAGLKSTAALFRREIKDYSRTALNLALGFKYAPPGKWA